VDGRLSQISRVTLGRQASAWRLFLMLNNRSTSAIPHPKVASCREKFSCTLKASKHKPANQNENVCSNDVAGHLFRHLLGRLDHVVFALVVFPSERRRVAQPKPSKQMKAITGEQATAG
jgi:hypothetical protein